MLLKILICEDNEMDLLNLKNCIHNYFTSHDLSYKIDCCSNKDILTTIISSYDLLFLDIELGELNGIELGLELLDKKKNCEIIITSSFKEYLIDGYKIHAKRYFLKPINQTHFNIEMDSVIKQILEKFKGIHDKKISENIIYFKDITFIEFDDRKTKIHLNNNKILNTTYPLKYWLELLKNYTFGQTHKSFIVNYDYVLHFENQDVILKNEQRIPLSRNYKKEFINNYLESLHEII